MPVPHPPVQTSVELAITLLPSMRGALEALKIPTPLHPELWVIVLPRIVGEELPT